VTNEEARALYDRAVAAGFRLEPGCRVWVAGQLVTIAWADEYEVGCAGDGCTVMIRSPAGVWCDFREAPSLGCMLGQVRAAWGDPHAATSGDEWDGWHVYLARAGCAADERRYVAEAEAVVAALEAASKFAPKVRP
jgi:hypothetical protein